MVSLLSFDTKESINAIEVLSPFMDIYNGSLKVWCEVKLSYNV